jgi:hypothetical protein
MKKTLFWALLALNVVLLVGLIAPYVGSNAAMAQRAGGGGRRPDILMVPGQQLGGGSSDVVYLIDSANRQMAAISLNNKGNGLDTIGPQSLDRVFEAPEMPNEKNDRNNRGAR